MAAHPVTLTVSPGRSGTTFLARTLLEHFGRDAEVHHEFLWHPDTKPAVFHRRTDDAAKREMLANPAVRATVDRWAELSERRPVVDFGWTMRGLIPVFRDVLGDRLRVLVVHRHPVSVAASFAAMGAYARWRSPDDHSAPDHPRALFPQFRDRWPGMTAYERMLYLWLEVTASGLEWAERLPAETVRVEKADDFFADPDRIGAIAAFCGFPGGPIPPSPTRNRIERRDRETFPMRDQWRRTFDHPELLSLADELGYDMSEATVRSLAEKYRLPDGLGPRLRCATGYWTWRNRAGLLAKSLGVRWAGARATRP